MNTTPLPPIADLAPVRSPERPGRSVPRPEAENERFEVPGVETEHRAAPDATSQDDRRAAVGLQAPPADNAGHPNTLSGKSATPGVTGANLSSEAENPASGVGAIILQGETAPAATAASNALAGGTFRHPIETLVAGTAARPGGHAAGSAGAPKTAPAADSGTGVPATGTPSPTGPTLQLGQGEEPAGPIVAGARAASQPGVIPDATASAAPANAEAADARQQIAARLASQAAASAQRLDGSADADTDLNVQTGGEKPSLAASMNSAAPQTGTTAQGAAVINANAVGPAGASTAAPPIQNNIQLAAQAIASGDADMSADAMPRLHASDGSALSHNFHAEMRAALDTPTQTAAYTARGAAHPSGPAHQVALQISRAAEQNADKLTIQLRPAELGKVTVELEVRPDNRVVAVISADRSETIDLLERDARSLERALNDAGLKTDSGSLEFNLNGQGNSTAEERQGETFDGAVILPGAGTDSLDDMPGARPPLILPEGRIDIQV